jgi:hypothetical protein
VASALVSAATLIQTSPEHARQIHTNKVRQLLPPHSALPPLLDLSQSGENLEGASRKWEDRFTGMMGVREITDPGILEPAGPGSISTTTTEYGTPLWALPARACDAVIIAMPVVSKAHLAYNRRYVYSTFSLEISQVLKGKSAQGIRKGERVTAAQFGATLRFPSGHIETFIMAREGFLEVGKQYLLFVWKPIRSDRIYVAADAYLIEEGLVFPVNLDAHESPYERMPFTKFEAKVKAAIAKNIDAN